MTPDTPAPDTPAPDTAPRASRTWTATFPWEGTRLRDRLADLLGTRPTGDAWTVRAYVSESPELREVLRGQLQDLLRVRGVPGRVRVRSAYKTAYFWLTEEVRPVWRRSGADTLSVRYPPGATGRFLQELYPLSAELEDEGVQFRAAQGDEPGVYRATLSRAGRPLWEGQCEVPLRARVTLDGRDVLAPTGQLTVQVGPDLHREAFPTDAELVWDWYAEQVMPGLHAAAHGTAAQPAWEDLRVTVHASEPDVPLALTGERVSMTEALAEDLYFGTLDALKARAGLGVDTRTLMPGRIIPVVLAAPGQDTRVTVHLTFPAGPHAAVAPAWEPPDPPDGWSGAVSGPLAPARVWAQARAAARDAGLTWTVPATSARGRPVPAVLRAATGASAAGGGVLVTGGQHANETTGPVAALNLICTLAAGPRPFAVLPLENPDGADLHRALTQRQPEHMHHAARYTAPGDDLEARLRAGDTRWEAGARDWAARAVQADLHLNLHGYPAHEWVRPFSGYAPHGFESWAVPTGFLTIVLYRPDLAGQARALAHAAAQALDALPDVRDLTRRALRAHAAHTLSPHFELVDGWPFMLRPATHLLCPVTVITEAPDETVYGERFRMLVRAQEAVCRAALALHARGDLT